MRLAFALFKYFPFGGLQREVIALARMAVARGHEVSIYALRWEGPSLNLPGVTVHVLAPSGLFRHQRYAKFGRMVRSQLEPGTVLIGFNKMKGLDVYYAADGCLRDKYSVRATHVHFNPRVRTLLRLESDVFGETNAQQLEYPTDHLPKLWAFLAPLSLERYQKSYPVLKSPLFENHICILPPGIRRDCQKPADLSGYRREIREKLGLPLDARIILMVGSGFKTKGVDRAIRVLGHLQSIIQEQFPCHLVIIGDDKSLSSRIQAKRAGLASQVHFLGGRDDVPNFLFGADVLLHPAYFENAGMVILEALSAGLPVCVTQQCGYASFVQSQIARGSGEVWSEPLDESACAKSLWTFLVDDSKKTKWEASCARFVQENRLYDAHEIFLERVESCQIID